MVDVAKSGALYSSVAAAIASVTDASATKPYVIAVAPGRYVEPPITMKPYVNVVARGGFLFDTVLAPSDLTQHFIRHAAGSVLRGLSIEGPSSVDTAAVDYQGTGYTPAFIFECAIRSGYRGVWCHPASYGTLHVDHLANQYSGSKIQKFLCASDHGNVTALLANFMSGPSGAAGTVFCAEGPNTSMTLDACAANAPGSDYCLWADDGAQVRAAAMTFHRGNAAVRIGPNGATKATLVDLSGGCTIASENFPEDIGIDATNGTVWILGRARPSQFRVTAGSTIAGAVLDPSTNRFTALGDLVAGSLDITAAGIAVGTSAPLNPATYAQWAINHQGFWGFIDIT